MRYPVFVPNADLMTDEARIFRPGERVQIARAPVSIGADGDVFGMPAPVPLATWGVLDHAVKIVHRITPWAKVYAVPIIVIEDRGDGFSGRELLKRKDCNKDYVKAGGLSFDAEDLIALSLSLSANDFISAAYHEAWHQVEKILDKKILDDIDGHLIPSVWGSAYLDSAFERRARCFETWCMYYEEGMPARRLTTWIDEVFDSVATGEVAREWKRQQKSKRAAR